jgi:hypothetical protein
MYNLEFELEKKDFLNLGRDLLTIKKYNKPYLINGGIALILIYTISIIIFKNWMSIVYATLIPFLVLYGIQNNGQTMYKAAKDAGLNRKFVFGDSSFSIETGGSAANYSYTDIKELYNTSNNVIFVCKHILLFVPKNRTVNINLYDFLRRKSNVNG